MTNNLIMIENKMLPVPLKYTYPIIRSVFIKNSESKEIDKYYYIPEVNKWWKVKNRFYNLFHKYGINYEQWMERWIYYSNSILDNYEIENIITKYYFRCLPNTKNYIRNLLRKNPEFGRRENFLGLTVLTREDFITEYNKSRQNSIINIHYDFSLLPDIIENHKTMIPINVLDINPDTGEPIGIWYTCFTYLISRRQDHPILGVVKNKKLQSCSRNEWIQKAEEVHGKGTYNYNKVDYKNNHTKVLIYCPRCKEYFWQHPNSHLQGHGCSKCAKLNIINNSLKEREQSFIDKAIKKFGDIFDYSKVKYIRNDFPVEIIDTRTGQSFFQNPRDHLKYSGKINGDTIGESFVRKWLLYNNIKFSVRKSIKLFDKYLIPDFIIVLNKVIIWIEYNGKQHYNEISWFHKLHEDFIKQLNRDSFERDYCTENHILLIEIPYTYNTYEKVKELLDRVILGGEDINTIIDYQSLYKN